MGKTKSSGGSADAPKTALDENGRLLLRQSIAVYLQESGFFETLTSFLIEAELKVQDWKTQSLDLELIFDKHLQSSGHPSENIYSKTSKQELEIPVIDEGKRPHDSKKKQKNLENDAVKDGHDIKDLHVISGEKKKKKSEVCFDISDGAQQGNLSQQGSRDHKNDSLDVLHETVAKSEDKKKKRKKKGADSNPKKKIRTKKDEPCTRALDFDNLEHLTSSPKVGDLLAYRIIQLSSQWVPDCSSFRVGKVTSFDRMTNQIILVPVTEYPIEHGDSDDTSSPYKEDGSLEIEYGALVDVRYLQENT